jgi:hypothetical protein
MMTRPQGKWILEFKVLTKTGHDVNDNVVVIKGVATLVSNSSGTSNWSFSLNTKGGKIEEPILLDFYLAWHQYVHKDCYILKFEFESVNVMNSTGTAKIRMK